MGRMPIMVNRKDIRLGIYEKAMPDNLSWIEKLRLVKKCGFDFMELSIDESDQRLNRLIDIDQQRLIKQAIEETNVPIYSICLSGHRKYPLGSHDKHIQRKALKIMSNALELAVFLGVQRIQMAGYDVYYEESDQITHDNFLRNLKVCVEMAAGHGIILAFETMETNFMNTISKVIGYINEINSPYLQVYPDLGNLYNSNINKVKLDQDIEKGRGHVVAVHLKDTVPDVYRNLQFGEGRVDFKHGIEAFYNQGVRIFNCEIWDDGKGQYLNNMIRTIDLINQCLKK